MKNIYTNQRRTAEYLKNFSREKTLKYLVKVDSPIIFDVGANNGLSTKEFKTWWPGAVIHCFEPQEECWDGFNKLKKENYFTNIILNKCAVGNKPTKNATFYSHEITTGQSGFIKINTQSKDSIDLNKLKHEKDLNKLANIHCIS